MHLWTLCYRYWEVFPGICRTPSAYQQAYYVKEYDEQTMQVVLVIFPNLSINGRRVMMCPS